MSVLAPTSPAGERRPIHLFRDVTATKELRNDAAIPHLFTFDSDEPMRS